MFETEDGVIDTSNFGVVELEAFKKKYPNAKPVSGDKKPADFYSGAETYSGFTPKQDVVEDDIDIIIKNIEKYSKTITSGSPVAGGSSSPDEEKFVSKEGMMFLDVSDGAQQGYVDKQMTGRYYTQDILVKDELDNDKYISLAELNTKEKDPEYRKFMRELQNKYTDKDFEPYEKAHKHYDPNTDKLQYVSYEKIFPYAQELNELRAKLTEAKKRGGKNIPNWEGAVPPEDLLKKLVADQMRANDEYNFRKARKDKAIASLTDYQREATIEQAEQIEKVKRSDIDEYSKMMDSLQEDALEVKKYEALIKYAKDNGKDVSPELASRYVSSMNSYNSDLEIVLGRYEKAGKDYEDLKDINEKLPELKKDYSVLRKGMFTASTVLSDMAYGLGGLVQTRFGAKLVSDEVALERKKEIEIQRQKYRDDVSFEDAFSSPENLGRFLAEETFRQLPIFAVMATTGGVGSLAGLGVRAGAAFSGLTIGASSAGQQINEMNYEEYLNVHNDIEKYGVDLEYNNKERSDIDKYLVGLGFGAAEGLFSVAPTYLLGSRFFKNAFGSLSKTAGAGELLTGAEFKAFSRKLVAKEFALGTAGESITEGLTQLTQNLIIGNDNIFEGIDHAMFSGGFFGGFLGGGSVAMGAAARTLMPQDQKIEIDTESQKLRELRSEYSALPDKRSKGAKVIRKQIEEASESIYKKIEDFGLEFQNKMSFSNFETYKKVLETQSEYRAEAKEVYNDKTLSAKQKNNSLNELVKKYNGLSPLVENFKKSNNNFDLLKQTDKVRHDRLTAQAAQNLEIEQTDANKDKINREAYKLYISEEFDADRKKNQSTLRKTKTKNKEHFFETVNEAQKEANEKLKNPEKLSKREKDWWEAVKEDTRKGVDAKGRVKQVGLNGFTMDVDGVDFWLTIKEQAVKNERAGTATHEAGSHIILKNAFGRGLNWGAIAGDIIGYLKQNDPSMYDELFGMADVAQRVASSTDENVFAEDKKGNKILNENVDPAIRVAKDVEFAEEVVVNFIEKFNKIDKTKKASKTFLYGFGRFLNKETGIVDDLSTQTKIVSFISSFAQKINDGTFSKEDLGKVKSEAEKLGLTVEQTKDAKAEPEGRRSLSLLEDINNLVPKNVKTKEEFLDRKVFNAVFQSTQKSVEPKNKLKETNVGSFLAKKDPSILKTIGSAKPNEQILKVVKSLIKDESSTVLTQQEIDRALELVDKDISEIKSGAIYNYIMSREASSEEKNIMLDRVRERLINYDPTAVRKTKSGEPITFGEFLFANTAFSQRDAKKKLAIDSERTAESLDTEEARQVAEPVAETTTTEDPRVEYQNLVEASVLPAKMVTKMKEKMLLVTKTLKSRIDAAVSKNKTVTPLMSEIKKEMGVQADILFKKVLGAKRGGELRNNLLKLKKPILENMTTTWLQGAMPFAIQKSVDGKFIDFPDWQGKNIDRENVNTYKAGRTDGKPIVRRLPNAANKIGDSQFLTYMFDSNGDVVRGAKESLSKALAQEYAIDMYNKELKDSNSEIRKAFVDNQEMLGTVLADNFIQEFSRQSERGSVKRSRSDINNTIDTYRTALELHINGDIDGADTLIKSLSKEDQEGWEVITGYLSAKNYKYKKNLENLDAPSNVRGILETYFANKSDRDNDVAMKQMYDFSSSLIDALPNSLVKALGSDFFGVHFRYLNPKQKNSYGDKIREKIKSLDATDTDIGLEVNDIRLVQAGSGIVLKITNNILNKKFKSADEKIKQFESKYGDEVRALNSANSKAIETVFSTVFDLAIEKPQQAVGFLRMLESTTNIAKSLRALTGIMDIQMTAESQAVYINKKTGQGYTNTANKSKAKEIESGEVVINTKHPNYKQALEFIKKGSKQSIDQLLRIKGEHAKPSSNFNSEAAANLIESLSVAISNPGNIAKVKQAFLFNLKNSLQGFNQQLNTKVLSDTQDAKLGTTSDIGEARLLAMSKKDLDSFYDISGTQRVGKINRDILSIFDKSAVEKRSKLSTVQKAIDNSRKRSYSQNTKGISVYDFDDTLAFSKSQIIVKKDGKTFKINAAQFAKQGETLLAEGAEFDFSEFNKVVKGQAGPLIPRIQKAIDKFGNNNIFILTARPVASETAIHAFMKGLGIDIPRANITGLANSTAQAKADWMVGKVAEGFNDFYFVDDAIKNVQAVKDVLETFDVNSKVQQAIAKGKASMSTDLNQMIERNKGVRAETTYSKVLARKKGANKGKFKFFVPYSAEDFKGLTSYTLAGKGKQGEADQRFFDRTLILPYTRGIAAMEGATQALKNDYKNLLDMFGLKKELPKKIGDTDFTTDQAVRVYLWDKQGFDIPNISKRDQNKLSSLVSKDPDLVGFAEGLMAVSKKDNWVNPKDHWDVGSILKDLNDITDNVNRKEYLAEFIENVDEMFDKTTLNKLEAIYGTNYVDALQDSIRRMKSGSNTPRSAGKIERKWLNWVNNSVGTIMFFNRRSALLQMLSFTNFINWSDNNPAMAAAAFANQPLYWKKWAEIFNSDKLKERRGGLKSDIQESEIANQAKNSKDKAAAVVSYLLKIGFTPTQIADSFAIATGGATFLINRTKKYEKQGLSKKEAEAKAFEDFGRISDETQQSGDPMLISQQQSSHLGRLILAFQNTPMQYTRLMKKAGKDIVNRRGSDVENLSKIAYYGFVQNLIFSSLQSALFALIPGFDDEEADDAKLEDKAIRTANSMVDTILRGSGLAGAVISTLKNAIMRYQKEDKKAQERYGGGDQTYTMLELANISPPIGSKLRKIYSAIQTKKFNQAAIEEMGYDLTIDGKLNPSPNYEIIANISSAVGNLPLDRLLSEVKSITEAFDSRNTSYQRLALALGWRTWDVNVRNEEQDLIKNEAKKRKKEASKQRAKDKRDIKSADKKRKKELEDRKKRRLKEIKKLYLK